MADVDWRETLAELAGMRGVDWREAVISLTGSSLSAVDWRQALLTFISSTASPVDWREALEAKYPGVGWEAAIVLALSTPPPYVASAVHFDGSTSLRIASLSASASALFSSIIWFKTTQARGVFYVVDPENDVDPYFNLISGILYNEVGAVPFAVSTNMETHSTSAVNDGLWHCMILGFDGASLAIKVYIDDVDVTNVDAIATTPFTVGGNGLETWIGTDGFDNFVGDIADFRVLYGISLLDGGGDIPLATRRLFIDEAGKPVDPAVATAALGTAGTLLFSGSASAFGTNQGTGGSFTTTGTLTDASSHP
jgi:hypothetical protein